MIPNEVRLNRSLPNIYGEAVYNTNSLRSTTKLGFRDSLRLFFYNKPALLPSMPWRDNIAPDKPVNVTAVKYGNDSVVLNWTKPVASDELNKAWQFVIYRTTNPVVDTSLAENILYITTNDTTAFTDTSFTPDSTWYYVVTTTDRFHNESMASNAVSTLPPAIACPADTMLVLNSTCSAALPDFTSRVSVQASSPVTITQIPVAGSVIYRQQDTLITIIATDVAGNGDTCTFHIRTVDHYAPVITSITAGPATLWPPNHTMRTVNIDYTLTDNCGPVSASLAVSSNEPAANYFEPDFEVVDAHHVKLRAEKSHLTKDRLYTIAITATDSAGNTSTGSTTVKVSNLPGEEDGILTVKAFPNPSPGQFVIMTLSTSPKTLSISVTDNSGKLIESRNGLPATGLFLLGNSYVPGVYYLQVKQGNSKQTIKLIKL
jgi:hypothetical protein